MQEISLAPEIIEAAKQYLKEHDVIHETVKIPLADKSELKFVVSPRHNDLVALSAIKHNGETYYLGLPKP